MFKNFIYWLESIEEDTPLPYEINHIYFCLHKSNDYIFLSFGGNQHEDERAFNFEYYPLEAQFFDVHKYDKNFNLLKLRTLVEKILENSFFHNLFFNKMIYISFFGENNRFKFINN